MNTRHVSRKKVTLFLYPIGHYLPLRRFNNQCRRFPIALVSSAISTLPRSPRTLHLDPLQAPTGLSPTTRVKTVPGPARSSLHRLRVGSTARRERGHPRQMMLLISRKWHLGKVRSQAGCAYTSSAITFRKMITSTSDLAMHSPVR